MVCPHRHTTTPHNPKQNYAIMLCGRTCISPGRQLAPFIILLIWLPLSILKLSEVLTPHEHRLTSDHVVKRSSLTENVSLPHFENRQNSSSRFTESYVSHRAGLFSQLFMFLNTYAANMERTSNSSSTNWKIVDYSPAVGTGWAASHFEKVFLPVRRVSSPPTSQLFYWRVRAQAQSIFQLRPELEKILRLHQRQLNLQLNSTVCVHVRRGDKKEGINSLSDNELLRILKGSFSEDTKALYLITDDVNFIDSANLALAGSVKVVTFPELECTAQNGVGNLECFIISVMIATKVCHTFVGSSTSNLSRFIMLLGQKFYDLDGVVDFFASKMLGQWYLLPDHCHVVDEVAASGHVCGHLSHRCPYCKRNDCSSRLSECEMPP